MREKTLIYLALRAALDASGFRGPALFRVTEAQNLSAVLAHGTDRAGRPEVALDWKSNGYAGRERRWSEVVFALTEDEVRRGLVGLDPERPMSLDKLGEHDDAHVLVYDGRLLERVNDKQYAARDGATLAQALVLVVRARDGLVIEARCSPRPCAASPRAGAPSSP